MSDVYAEMPRDLERSALDLRRIARLRALVFEAEREKERIYQRMYGYVPRPVVLRDPGPHKRVPARRYIARACSA